MCIHTHTYVLPNLILCLCIGLYTYSETSLNAFFRIVLEMPCSSWSPSFVEGSLDLTEPHCSLWLTQGVYGYGASIAIQAGLRV